MAGRGAPRSVLLTAVLAVLATAAALGAVAMLRPDDDSADAVPGPSGASVVSSSDCGQEPCRILATRNVNGTTVELLADAGGANGRFRVGGTDSTVVVETTITTMGARLNGDSLRCLPATVSACLVRGPLNGGLIGEVLVARGNNWRSPAKPYFADAGVVALANVSGDDSAEVVVVRRDCSDGQSGSAKCQGSPVLAEVYDLAGKQLGCTKRYTSLSQIRGWPDIRLTQSDLRPC